MPSGPSTAAVLLSSGVLDEAGALEMIETVIRIYREHKQTNAPVPPSGTFHRRSSDFTAPTLDGSYARTSDRSTPSKRELRPRTTYALNVKDGRTLNLQSPTPAMVKIVDALRAHGALTLQQLFVATQLQRSTISNILTILNKQHVLSKSEIPR